jgi:hypothetical protein
MALAALSVSGGQYVAFGNDQNDALVSETAVPGR